MLKPSASRVNRRMFRVARFCPSANNMLMCPGSGSPVMSATVYGLFHYVFDTLAGAALAIAVVAAHRYLSGGGLQER